MKKRLIGATVLILVASLTLRTYFRPAASITNEKFQALSAGMTLQEVQRILGGPARNECDDRVIVWAPRGDALNSVGVNPGTPDVSFLLDADSPDGRYELVWLSESGLIAAVFDGQDQLCEMHFSDVHVNKAPGPIDWLSSRF